MSLASAFRSALCTVGFALVAAFSPAVLAQGSSTAADGFNPNVIDGNVYAMALQPDGKVVIAGAFGSLQPNNSTANPVLRGNVARLQPDGTVDSAFFASIDDGQINALVLQPDGKIVIGGTFTTIAGSKHARIARLNADGSVDQNFNANLQPNGPEIGKTLTPDVMAVALQSDGKIVVGGGFTEVQVNGGAIVTRNRIVRLNADGTVDTSFDPNADGMVLSLAVQSNGKVLLGGGFANVHGVARNHLARLAADGTPDSFDPSANNSVSAIEPMADGTILIGGTFTTLTPNGGSAVTTGAIRIARLNDDGTVVPDFVGDADGPVSVLKAQPDGGIIVGGAFSTAGNGSQPSPYAARLLPGGKLDTTFNPGPNFNVYAVAVQRNGSVLLAGGFTTLNGTGATSIVRNHVARVSPTGALDADFRPDLNGRLRSLGQQPDGKLLVGGSFTSISGETHYGLVRLNKDGTLDQTFKVDIFGSVAIAVTLSDGRIIIGGSFSRVNGTVRLNLARLSSTGVLDDTFDPAPDGQVLTILVQSDGKLLVGGGFSSFAPDGTTQPVPHFGLGRINTDGTLDLTFGTTTDGTVSALAAQADGKIVIGGAFTNVGTSTSSVPQASLARLNADGSVDTTFLTATDGAITSIAVDSDKNIVVAGSFGHIAKDATIYTRNNIARIGADGAVDPTFDPNPNSPINALVLQGDKVVVGGFFTTVQPNAAASGSGRNYVARFNKDGTLDSAFDLALDRLPGNLVNSLLVDSDGKLIIGGAFTQVQSVARYRIARINTDGTVDTSFNADRSLAGGIPIEALSLRPNGQIYAAGNFANILGTGSSNLARFNSDSTPDTGFVPNINGPVHAVAQGPVKGTPLPTQYASFAWLDSSGLLKPVSFPGVTDFGIPQAFAVQPDGKILMGVSSTINGIITAIARFNPDLTVDSSFTSTATGTISSIKVLSDGKILIGGTFTTTVGSVTYNNLARLNADGTFDSTFNASTDSSVMTIAIQPDGKILVGGSFSSAVGNGTTSSSAFSNLVRFNSDWTIDTTFVPNPNAQVATILPLASGKILIGGGFSTVLAAGNVATAVARSGFAQLNADGSLDQSVDLAVNGFVQTIVAQSDNKVLLGGSFTSVGGKPRNYLARLNSDLTVDDGFNPNPNSGVVSIVQQSDGKILIGGNFSALQPNSASYDAAVATPRNRIARLNADGTVDASFNPNFDGSVSLLQLYPDGSILAAGPFTTVQPTGALFVGGAFSSINGVAISNLALFSNDGSTSSAFAPNPNGSVNAILALADGRAVIGGAFTTVAGATRNRLARFNADNSLDTGFNPNASGGDVFTLALQSDGKLIVGGSFTDIGGSGHGHLARINTDGTVDGSFASVSSDVHVLAIQPDKRILISRQLSASTSQLQRLNLDGSVDSSFSPANDGQVLSIAVQADGKIIVGGTFTTIAGHGQNYLARLNADGSFDETVAPTFDAGSSVTAVTIQPDGKLLIAGTFSIVNGLPRFGVARIVTPEQSADSFTVSADRTSVVWARSGAAPDLSSVEIESSSDGLNWAALGQATRVGGTANWQLTTAPLATPTYFRARGIEPVNGSSGLIEGRGQLVGVQTTGPVAPTITSSTAATAASGSNFIYTISASGATSFTATGLPAGLAINSTTGVISGTPTATGNFSIALTATNSAGSGTATLALTVVPAGTPSSASRLINLSVRAQSTPANPIIAGFVIVGSAPQSILLRAVGPALGAMGVSNPLAAPNLQVYTATGQLIHNSNSWSGDSTLTSEFSRLGAFALAANSADAAVELTLQPGAYTLHVNSPTPAGGTALAEVYDASSPPLDSPRLVNLSARGVISGSELVTGGFVITGSTPKQILVRGIGPGLTSQQVTGVVADPVVKLYHIVSNVASVIAQNDNWGTPMTVDSAYPGAAGATISSTAATVGAFALTNGSADASLLVTVAPGIYTAEVSGAGGATGAAMVEIYEVP